MSLYYFSNSLHKNFHSKHGDGEKELCFFVCKPPMNMFAGKWHYITDGRKNTKTTTTNNI